MAAPPPAATALLNGMLMPAAFARLREAPHAERLPAPRYGTRRTPQA